MEMKFGDYARESQLKVWCSEEFKKDIKKLASQNNTTVKDIIIELLNEKMKQEGIR